MAISKKIKVLMLAAEITPIAKVGGLGDVIGSLPPALLKLGCDARIMLPL
jgi:starch synthase